MPKKLAIGLIIFLLASCASQNTSSNSNIESQSDVQSPEADLTAPGMIPLECEQLLQKSQEWKYHPGVKWKPESTEQALDAVRFFSEFTLVPQASSKFWAYWMKKDPSSNEAEAQKNLDIASRAQTCDISLTRTFLMGTLKYLAKSHKEESKKLISTFILNQQARTAPLIIRASTIDVIHEAHKQGWFSYKYSIPELRKKLTQSQNEIFTLMKKESALDSEKTWKKELELSELMRSEIAKGLPLP